MPIQSITISETGLVNVNPSVIYIQTTDTYAQVTANGYLTLQKQAGFTFNNQQMALVTTSDDGVVWLTVQVVGSVVSLISPDVPGETLLPTIANHLIVATDTTGTLANLTGTAVNNGSLQAGLSGTAGTLISYPSAATKGSLILAAVANTGNTNTTISNVAMGQASVVSIPDPANALGRLLIGATATPFVSGNFPQNSGTGGLMVDSGIAVSALAQTANVVLLSPAADQTITAHNLTLAQGNLVAGSSGHAGTVTSFPGTAANGSLILAGVNAGGAFNTTISNGTMAQSTVYSIPDVTAVTGQFLVKTAALVSGNLIQASGTAGVTIDSGIASSNVQLKTQVKAVLTGNIGASGAGPLTITVAGMTAASVVVATVSSSSNPCYVLTATPGTGNFALTVNTDPGASLIVNYIAYITAQ